MNFANPLQHPDTAGIRDAMHSWVLIQSPEQTEVDTLRHAQTLLNVLAEYQNRCDSNACPNWQDRLAFDMAVSKFDHEVAKFYQEASDDQIKPAIAHIREKIDLVRQNPLRARYTSFSEKAGENETLDEFVGRVQPLLNMLDLYVDCEFYPTWDSQQAWKRGPFYDSELHDAWFTAQLESSANDRYLLNSVLGVISSLEHRLTQSGDTLSADEANTLQTISTKIVQKSKLI